MNRPHRDDTGNRRGPERRIPLDGTSAAANHEPDFVPLSDPASPAGGPVTFRVPGPPGAALTAPHAHDPDRRASESDVTQARCVVVVGAGVAGLACARAVQDAGVDVVVVDKSRGVGGRATTRRAFDSRFDHGAQYCTARDDRFADVVRGLADSGTLRRWFDRLPVPPGGRAPSTDPCDRWVGADGMSALPKAMAQGVDDVRTRRRVRRVDVDTAHATWRLELDDTSAPADGTPADSPPVEELVADCVVWTPPVPQSLTLLDSAGIALPAPEDAGLRRVRYLPCVTLLVQPAGPVTLGDDGALAPLGGPVAWIADNVRKGITSSPSVTVQATGEWSAAHFDDDEATVTADLLDACRPWLPDPPAATLLHRWRYATPDGDLPSDVVAVRAPVPAVFCGDAFGGGRVEGAFVSGLRAADRVLALLDGR